MIILAADHGGLELKEKIKNHLRKEGNDIVDVGAFDLDPADSYTFYMKLAVKRMLENKEAKGIFFCRSGVGPSIIANRNKGVYAAVAISKEQVAIARGHNNINVLSISSDTTSVKKAKEMIKTFLDVKFEGGRHTKRVKDIDL